MKTIYISGAMTGRQPEEIAQEFGCAERRLRKAGYKVINPARLPMARWPWLYRLMGYKLTLLVDLVLIARCAAIAELGSASQSRGAQVELAWARAIGVPYFTE